MNLKNLSKKITAGITAAALGFSITVAIPPTAEALGAGDIIGIGIGAVQRGQQISALKKDLDKQIKSFNDTEEGREQLYQQYRDKEGVNTDPEVNARMDRIMTNLTNAVGQIDPTIYDKPYKYFVSNNETLNAFCSLGHVMVVNIGAFNFISTDDEIAAIVGHEMGHGQKDHVVKGNKKAIDKLILGSVLEVGSAVAGGGAIGSAIANVTTNNSIQHTNKKQESEADSLSWDYMLHTNYNIGACAAAMQKLSEVYGGKDRDRLQAILNPSNHPGTDRRRDEYVKKLYEYSGKHVTAKDGVITINGKTFTTVAAANKMSSAERSYFVLGNLAKAYHNGKTAASATVSNGTIYLDDMAIMTPAEGDEDAYILAERLTELINTPNPDDKKKSDKDKKKSDKEKKKADKDKK